MSRFIEFPISKLFYRALGLVTLDMGNDFYKNISRKLNLECFLN